MDRCQARSLDAALGSERKHAPSLHPHSNPPTHPPPASFSPYSSVQKHLSKTASPPPSHSQSKQVIVVIVHPASTPVIDVLPVADRGSLVVGVELGDLVAALHASQRCLSKAAFDCTAKMAHFASEWVACSSPASGRREKKKKERHSQRVGAVEYVWTTQQSPVSSFWLYTVSDWFSGKWLLFKSILLLSPGLGN